jgi:hypothetical protein
MCIVMEWDELNVYICIYTCYYFVVLSAMNA